MKVLNIGSLNIDYVYSVDHIIQAGETETTGDRGIYLGGKGINQTIAVRKAGVEIFHAGLIGADGDMFIEACEKYGVNHDFIKRIDIGTGHTIIQVDKNGQNSILLYGGANQEFTKEYVDEVLSHFGTNDILMLQNEINLMPYIIDCAYEKRMRIILNPSPYNEKLKACDMSKISILILNEIEGAQLAGQGLEPDQIIDSILEKYPDMKIVLTLGKDGSVYADRKQRVKQKAFPVKAVDTTAAGDTFTGFFIAGIVENLPIEITMRVAAKAASIAVTRKGAVLSIPSKNEVF